MQLGEYTTANMASVLISIALAYEPVVERTEDPEAQASVTSALPHFTSPGIFLREDEKLVELHADCSIWDSNLGPQIHS